MSKQEATRLVVIPTWRERCESHPDHQSGLVTHSMVGQRMQEEIDDLRERIAALEEERDHYKMAATAEAGFADQYKAKCAALEAALEQARVALEGASSWLATVPNAMASGAYGGVLSALRAIEEVRK